MFILASLALCCNNSSEPSRFNPARQEVGSSSCIIQSMKSMHIPIFALVFVHLGCHLPAITSPIALIVTENHQYHYSCSRCCVWSGHTVRYHSTVRWSTSYRCIISMDWLSWCGRCRITGYFGHRRLKVPMGLVQLIGQPVTLCSCELWECSLGLS